MSKKRAIVSYDKLTIEQKKELLKSFPEGYGSSLTTIKTPAGETLEALIWETEDVIYLVKINKTMTKALDDDDDDEDEDDDLEDDIIKPDDLEEEDDEDDLPKKSKAKSKSDDHDDDDDDDDDDMADLDEDEDEDED
jgi:hypothetical protein